MVPFRLPRLLLPTTTDAQRNTIYALSTPPGKGGIAVVRVSGPDALTVWHRMVVRHHLKTKNSSASSPPAPAPPPTPWKLHRCRIVHPEDKSLTIDDGLAVYFRAPHSYTTQPTVELHVHSGRAVLSALLASLAFVPGCRPAEPGEFARRALLNGRLDLTQVEGLHDLLEADTEVQRAWALQRAVGETRSRYESLRRQTIRCLGQVEALIDFGEGEDIEEGVYEQARTEASNLLKEIQLHLSDSRRGELVRAGIKVAIFGPPNAGKSSLFNHLANRQASIVTPVPGTTRDVLEVTLDIGGLPVVLADTAGLRRTDDVVESIGVQRGIDAVKNADFSICVLPPPPRQDHQHNAPPPERPTKVAVVIPKDVRGLVGDATYFLVNKADLISSEEDSSAVCVAIYDDDKDKDEDEEEEEEEGACMRTRRRRPLASTGDGRAWLASLKTGSGTTGFVHGLAEALKTQFNLRPDGESRGQQRQQHAPLVTRERHRVHLRSACRFLEAFLATPPEDIVLAAEELRYAANSIGRVTGHIGVEDVLDSLFKDFCIGK